MFTTIATAIRRRARAALRAVHRRLLAWSRPATGPCSGSTVGDLTRTQAALVAENAFLRQQLVVLARQVTRPVPTPADRLRLVLLARLVRGWRAALLIVRPGTLLRWHRQGFRLVWRARSRDASTRPQVAAETVAAIQRLAAEHRPWGAERIRGELHKLGIRVGKRTVQRHMRAARPLRPRGGGQTWATFLRNHAHETWATFLRNHAHETWATFLRNHAHETWATFLRNHAHETWACDFLPVVDVGFRSLCAFFVVALGSRRVVHTGVTRHPTDAWVAQQLREATPFAQRPRYLIRDNDGKYGAAFSRVAAGSRITVLRTPIRAPRANAPARAPSGACAASASTTCSSSASASSGGCSAGTSCISTGSGHTRALAKRRRSDPPARCATVPRRCTPCRCSAASTTPTSTPRSGPGRKCSHDTVRLEQVPSTPSPPAAIPIRRMRATVGSAITRSRRCAARRYCGRRTSAATCH